MRALRTQRTLPTGRRRATTIRAGGTLILLSVGLLLSFAGPARAQTSGDGGGPKPYVVLTGKLDVPEGTTYREVVIFDGPLTIEGTVTKDAVAFNGDVVVTGRVNGNVFALNGRVTVKRGASVGGNVTSDRTPLIAPGTVTGVVQTTTHVDLGSLTFVGRFFVWLAATGTSFLIGLILTLLLPKAADAVAWTGRDRLGPAAAWGVGLSILVPVAAAFLVFTVVGTLLGSGGVVRAAAARLDRLRGGRALPGPVDPEAAEAPVRGVPARLGDPARTGADPDPRRLPLHPGLALGHRRDRRGGVRRLARPRDLGDRRHPARPRGGPADPAHADAAVTPPRLTLHRFSGTQREVGLQMGEAGRDKIPAAVDGAFADDLPSTRSREEQLRLAAGFRAFTEPRLPWLIERLDACAEAAGVDPLAFFATTVEELWYDPRTPLTQGRCSDLVAGPAATADGHLLVGHTNDLRPEAEDELAALEIAVDGDPVVLQLGGIPWLSVGWNDAGLSLTGNELSPNDERVGISRSHQVLEMIRARTLDAMVAASLRPDRASSYNNVLASADGEVVNVEGSATDAELTGLDADGHLAHTNHYACDRMLPFEGDPGLRGAQRPSAGPRPRAAPRAAARLDHPGGDAHDAERPRRAPGRDLPPPRRRAPGREDRASGAWPTSPRDASPSAAATPATPRPRSTCSRPGRAASYGITPGGLRTSGHVQVALALRGGEPAGEASPRDPDQFPDRQDVGPQRTVLTDRDDRGPVG